MPSHYKKLSPTSSTSGSSNSKARAKSPIGDRPISFEEIIASGKDKPPLIKLEDKIVWLSDDGPEYGTVKWLGKLPDQDDKWMAGVYFVRPIGTGLGEYNGHKLFDTPFKHASLVPIIGLIKAEDYFVSNKAKFAEIFPSRPPRKQKETYKFYTNDQQSLKEKRSPPEKKSLPEDAQEYTKNNENHSTKRSIDVPIYQVDMDQVDNSKFIRRDTSKSNFSHMKTDNRYDDPFEIGSMVEFELDDQYYHGVIRWMGILQPMMNSSSGYRTDDDYQDDIHFDCVRKTDQYFELITAGVEIEEDDIGISDGTYGGKRYFDCPQDHAIFVQLSKCTKDNRFGSSIASASLQNYDISSVGCSSSQSLSLESRNFGGIDCPLVMGHVDSITTRDSFERLLGKNRGIQGHHNSCYLDATLFSMFASATVFDSLLNRPQNKKDITEYSEVQKILKEEIVNPLRENYYVRADRVMKLRLLLEKISSMRGLTSEEKDPEEFLDMLLAEVLKTEPFLKFSTGHNSFSYQLFVEKDDNIELPTVQQLFEQSFFNSNLKLKEIPPCLILQMPRFGRQFKTYPRIMPTLYLDITNVLDNSPRECIICANLADYECRNCYGEHGDGLESVTYCNNCFVTCHSSKNSKDNHSYSELKVPQSFKQLKNHLRIPRVMMELFAVLCIETSHYVSFVKCGSQPNASWCFFDSMADRRGGQNGYNIPEVRSFDDMDWWLGKDGNDFLTENKDDKILPELPRRLFSDAYICFYSSEVQRYR